MRPTITLSFLLLIALAVTPAQSVPPLRGIVVSTDGKPVVGANVYGNYWKNCCPSEADTLKTDENGLFAFPHATDYVHIRAKEFRPLTIFVQPGESELRIVLEDAKLTTKNIPECPPQKEKQRRVGYWLQFYLPKKAKIKRVRGTDTLAYEVNYPHSDYWLILESGPLMGATDARESTMKDSSSFTERWISGPHMPDIGIDSASVSKDGRLWRSVGTSTGGATYQDVSFEAARYFDTVIDTVCLSSDVVKVGADVDSRSPQKP